jgi:hypothetical protein
MPLTLTFAPNTSAPQEIILPDASPRRDGAMTALQAYKLATLWTAASLPNPVVVNRTPALSFLPSATAPFSVIVPNASPVNDGVISAAQAAELEALWVASALPTPHIPGRSARLHYCFNLSLQYQPLVVGPATLTSNGLMTALMAAQLKALSAPVATYTAVITASNPQIWWRFNDASPSAVVVDTQGHVAGTQSDTGVVNYRQPGLITEAGQFSQGTTNNALYGVTSGGFPGGLVSTSHFAIEWWMQTNPIVAVANLIGLVTDGADEYIIGCGAGDGSGIIESAGGILITLPAGTYSGATSYYAITYDGATSLLYKNGVLLTSGGGPALGGANLTAMAFGGAAIGFGTFGGLIDELAVYNRVLGAPEILSHFNAGM